MKLKKKSGTLITANLALDLGKELFSIPGDIFKINSEGCNMLIRKGMAKSVSKSKDLLEEFNIVSDKTKKKIIFTDSIEKDIYNIIVSENLNIDEISSKLNIDISTLNFKLSLMEINKIIKKIVGGKYELF